MCHNTEKTKTKSLNTQAPIAEISFAYESIDENTPASRMLSPCPVKHFFNVRVVRSVHPNANSAKALSNHVIIGILSIYKNTDFVSFNAN